MSDADRCAEHAWAVGGVTTVEDRVVRVWICENCPAWTVEELDREHEVPWAETDLGQS